MPRKKSTTKNTINKIEKMAAKNPEYQKILDKIYSEYQIKTYDDLENEYQQMEFISTGNKVLDILISNRVDGGIPKGRMIEIYGETGGGKSLMAMTIAREHLKTGGRVLYFDSEGTFSWSLAEGLGLKQHITKDNFILFNEQNLFKIYAAIVKIPKVFEDEKDTLVIIDSVHAADLDLENKTDESEMKGFRTQKAQFFSSILPKLNAFVKANNITVLFINQVRKNIGVMFGDDEVTTGGMSIPFYSTVRMKLKKGSKIKNKAGEVIGQVLRVELTKNKVGAPYRKMDFEIYYSYGINPFSGWINVIDKYKIFSKSGGWYNVNWTDEETGEVIEKKQKKSIEDLLIENERFRNYVLKKIEEALKIKYENPFENLNKIKELQENIIIEEETDNQEVEEENEE